jgi:hypothetical protein
MFEEMSTEKPSERAGFEGRIIQIGGKLLSTKDFHEEQSLVVVRNSGVWLLFRLET